MKAAQQPHLKTFPLQDLFSGCPEGQKHPKQHAA